MEKSKSLSTGLLGFAVAGFEHRPRAAGDMLVLGSLTPMALMRAEPLGGGTGGGRVSTRGADIGIFLHRRRCCNATRYNRSVPRRADIRHLSGRERCNSAMTGFRERHKRSDSHNTSDTETSHG